jgi:hypothetical protein
MTRYFPRAFDTSSHKYNVPTLNSYNRGNPGYVELRIALTLPLGSNDLGYNLIAIVKPHVVESITKISISKNQHLTNPD